MNTVQNELFGYVLKTGHGNAFRDSLDGIPPETQDMWIPVCKYQESNISENTRTKAINVILWFYRRAKPTYGRLPFAEEVIAALKRTTPEITEDVVEKQEDKS